MLSARCQRSTDRADSALTASKSAPSPARSPRRSSTWLGSLLSACAADVTDIIETRKSTMPAEAFEPAGGMTVPAGSRRGGHVRRHAHNHGHRACRPLAAGLLLTAVASLQLVTPLLAEQIVLTASKSAPSSARSVKHVAGQPADRMRCRCD